MAGSAIERPPTVTLLPPELLECILFHLPYERPTIHKYHDEQSVSRSFKPQVAFAHVCRAWRYVALASKHWPGVRLSLKSSTRLQEGLEHKNGNALLYVHFDMEHHYDNFPLDTQDQRAPLLVLEQSSRIRTLFLRADAHNDESRMRPNRDANAYVYAIGHQPVPELQDLTIEWIFRPKLGFDFKQSFPRLRYLALYNCDLKGHRTLSQTTNLVHINFWGVRLFETIDELVDTFSQWKRLEYVTITECDLVSSRVNETIHERRAAYLPALREINLYDDNRDIGIFLTYIAFPPTARAHIDALSIIPEFMPVVGDAIYGHFDSPEGRSIIANAHSFAISWPDGYEILSGEVEVPETPIYYDRQHSTVRPEARFMFHQCGSIAPQISSLEENLPRFPVLETVSRLDLSLHNLFYVLSPPTQVLRRFVGTTQLVLAPKCRSVLDEIVKDATLLPQLARLELLGFRLLGNAEMVDLSQLLEAVREARQSLVEVVFRGCKIKEDAFEDMFGECHVQIGELPEARSAWFDSFAYY